MNIKEEDKDKHARDFVEKREDHPLVADWHENGVRTVVMSSGGRHFCAYVGVPLDHPLAGFDYDDVPIDCHGGLTYSGKGDGDYRPEGYWWYGWDYAHLGDYSHYDYPGARGNEHNEHDWTLDEVIRDCWISTYTTAKLMKLAEKSKGK